MERNSLKPILHRLRRMAPSKRRRRRRRCSISLWRKGKRLPAWSEHRGAFGHVLM